MIISYWGFRHFLICVGRWIGHIYTTYVYSIVQCIQFYTEDITDILACAHLPAGAHLLH